MLFDLPENYIKKNVSLIIHLLHDGNVEEDQWEDWNNNIEKSVEPENIDSDVPIVGPDNQKYLTLGKRLWIWQLANSKQVESDILIPI